MLGRELWVSDGTMQGTYLLKDIRNGAADSYPAYFTILPPRHSYDTPLLYFIAYDGTRVHRNDMHAKEGIGGSQLWYVPILPCLATNSL